MHRLTTHQVNKRLHRTDSWWGISWNGKRKQIYVGVYNSVKEGFCPGFEGRHGDWTYL